MHTAGARLTSLFMSYTFFPLSWKSISLPSIQFVCANVNFLNRNTTFRIRARPSWNTLPIWKKAFSNWEKKAKCIASVCNMRSLCLCLHPPQYYVLKDNHRCNIHQFALIDSTTPCSPRACSGEENYVCPANINAISAGKINHNVV